MLPYLSPEAPFAILLMLAAAAMIFKPLRAWRRSLVNTGVFFAACLVGDLLAGLLDGQVATIHELRADGRPGGAGQVPQ